MNYLRGIVRVRFTIIAHDFHLFEEGDARDGDSDPEGYMTVKPKCDLQFENAGTSIYTSKLVPLLVANRDKV